MENGQNSSPAAGAIAMCQCRLELLDRGGGKCLSETLWAASAKLQSCVDCGVAWKTTHPTRQWPSRRR
jgi:hypothetical protein